MGSAMHIQQNAYFPCSNDAVCLALLLLLFLLNCCWSVAVAVTIDFAASQLQSPTVAVTAVAAAAAAAAVQQTYGTSHGDGMWLVCSPYAPPSPRHDLLASLIFFVETLARPTRTQDMEPEYIAVTENSATAYVTLQARFASVSENCRSKKPLAFHKCPRLDSDSDRRML